MTIANETAINDVLASLTCLRSSVAQNAVALIEQLVADRARLSKLVAEQEDTAMLREGAERYQLIRARDSALGVRIEVETGIGMIEECLCEEELDKAVDEARAARLVQAKPKLSEDEVASPPTSARSPFIAEMKKVLRAVFDSIMTSAGEDGHLLREIGSALKVAQANIAESEKVEATATIPHVTGRKLDA